MALAGEPPAGYQSRDDGNRLDDTPARADDYSRWDAQLASETTGTPHINDVARKVRYNGAYFEIDVEVNGERGIVPVTWDMLRAHTPLTGDAYYARVYTSRGWADGRQVPGFGPDVILPEAFTPELTPVIFEYFKRAFVSWNRDFDGWTQAMADAWMKEAAIHVARVWTPEYVGGVAVASVRASQITGQAALGAAAVPNAAAATRACSGGRCLPATSRGGARFIARPDGEILDVTRIRIPGPRNSPFGKVDYLLGNVGTVESVGKGGFFRGVLGFSEENLGPALERHLIENFGTATIQGSRIRVVGTLTGPGGRSATVQSIWQVTPEGFVDLITAVPR